jgi:hypothetical protein
MKTDKRFWSYLAQFFLEWEMFQTKVVEEIKNTYFVFNSFFFSFENRAVYEILRKKCCTSGQVTDDAMAQAYCMLDN